MTPKPDVKHVCPVNEHCDESYVLLLTKGFCPCRLQICMFNVAQTLIELDSFIAFIKPGLFIKQFPSRKTENKSKKNRFLTHNVV